MLYLFLNGQGLNCTWCCFDGFLRAAPEKVSREDVGVAADVWGVGVLTFVL